MSGTRPAVQLNCVSGFDKQRKQCTIKYITNIINARPERQTNEHNARRIMEVNVFKVSEIFQYSIRDPLRE